MSRPRPQDLDAERSVLGACLLDSGLTAEIAEILDVSDWFDPRHALLWTHLAITGEREGITDTVTVAESLDRAGELASFGGRAALLELVGASAGSVAALRHAAIVREKAQQRALLDTCHEIVEHASANQADTAELIAFAEERIFAIARVTARTAANTDAVLADVFREIGERQNGIVAVDGLRSGFPQLDEMTHGFRPGELIIVAGRPSMGKSTLALNFIDRAITDGRGVFLASLETSAKQIVENLLAARARVSSSQLRRGRLGNEDLERVYQAGAEIGEHPPVIDDSSDLSVFALRSKCRRMQQRGDLSLVVLDYLQLMGGGKAESRQIEIATISRALKSLARELKVPVIALSQLNRGVENREDRKPRMSDLRESGAIEQDADVVLMLHREEYYKRTADNEGLAELIVAKQRNGPVGTVTLAFRREIGRFENYARPQESIR